MERPTSSLLNIDSADGIVSYSMEQLARDPSIIVGHPAPPGGHFFYVNELNQIQSGDQIFFSTEAENDPATVRKEMAELHQAQKQRSRFPQGTEMWKRWHAEVNRLGDALVEFWQGQRRIKSLRTVASVDHNRNLIAVTKPFELGYRPRVLGAVVRVVGFEEDKVDEVRSDKFHKAMQKHYGSNDWESDLKAYGGHLLSIIGGRG